MNHQTLGIARNKTQRIIYIKKQIQKRKSRFQIVGKQQQDIQCPNLFILDLSLPTSHSQGASRQQLPSLQQQTSSRAIQVFYSAKNHLKKVSDLQKKMGQLAKQRMTCLRQKQNQKLDESITKIANQATQAILAAQKNLNQISALQGISTEAKILKNMKSSLATQIQQASRGTRNQQQQYFRQVKAYESGATNSAIQLTNEQRQIMKGDEELLEQKKDDGDKKMKNLIQSITKLSTVYKQLGALVVAQGSVIDRIDYNIQQTQVHINKAIVHLQGANQAASSQFAEKVIKSLALAIILMAVILGMKYMK